MPTVYAQILEQVIGTEKSTDTIHGSGQDVQTHQEISLYV
jgi:hypothetical protein